MQKSNFTKKDLIDAVYQKVNLPKSTIKIIIDIFFESMLDLLLKNKEPLLHAQLINNVHLISFEEQNIKLRLKFKSETEILKNLSSTLERITKNKWSVTHSEEDGEKTIVEKQNIESNKQKEQIKVNPYFAEVFKHFPQAEIISIENKKSN